MITDFINEQMKNKRGFDTLEISIIFLKFLDSNPNEYEQKFSSLRKEIEGLIKRELEILEYNKMLVGILDYVMSEPQTNERSEAMNYLFELEFLGND